MVSDNPFRRDRSNERPTASRLFDAVADDAELYEDDGEFVLTVELPGFAEDDIDVRWRDDRLHVTAEQEDERRSRRYARSFSFPRQVDDEAATATYRNGVLEVRLPVVEESSAGRRIEVTGG